MSLPVLKSMFGVIAVPEESAGALSYADRPFLSLSIRNTEKVLYLDETYEMVDRKVPGLKTELFLHQRTVVRAMLDMERRPTLRTSDNTVMRSTCAILSEPMGAGKTVDILAVILTRDPKRLPSIYSVEKMVVRKRFHKVLRPTLVVVSRSVMTQWVEAIDKFTDLTYFIVDGVRALDHLVEHIESGKINHVNIVLVKCSPISRYPAGFSKKYPIAAAHPDPHMLEALGRITNVCWNRLVLDDFDILKFPEIAMLPNAVFTWFVSSTFNAKTKRGSIKHKLKLESTADVFKIGAVHISPLSHKVVCDNFNISNSMEFVEKSNNLGTPQFWVYKIANINARVIDALNCTMADMADVVDMLNADNMVGAADRLGIKSSNVIDIFDHVLGKQREQYIEAIAVVKFIKEQEANASNWLQGGGEPYLKKNLLKFEPVTHASANTRTLLKKYAEEYATTRDDLKKVINRIQGHFRDGECPICCSDLVDEDIRGVFIIKCCGIVVCERCCIDSVFKRMPCGYCTNCRMFIKLRESCCYLSSADFDYESMASMMEAPDEDKKEELADENKEAAAPVERPPTNPEDTTKKTVILDILTNRAGHYRKEARIFIKKMMVGRNIAEVSTAKKVLIFASYDSALKSMTGDIRAAGFEVLHLEGQYGAITTTVRQFNEASRDCVLMVNSIKNCAGINLQSATDLIFMHLIPNHHVESQVIGRAQRLHRQNRLQVHYVLYNNEECLMQHRIDYAAA